MRNPEVDRWFTEYDNPMKNVVLYMRSVILASDDAIQESIKWKSPTFSYKGNIASFNPRSKQHASLMFHTGASIPGDFPHLEGKGEVTRFRARDRRGAGTGGSCGQGGRFQDLSSDQR